MSSLVLAGDTSGSITVSAPAVAGTQTVTLPAASGQLMVSGNMPAFSAYPNSGQTITNATATKVSFQTKEFDTANAFDNTTNYRFQPLTAGYYQVTGGSGTGGPMAFSYNSVYKNGVEYKRGIQGATTSGIIQNTVSALVYLNGSTDYIELYFYQGSGISQTLNQNALLTYFQASMVRAA